jgi:hypothetical protein
MLVSVGWQYSDSRVQPNPVTEISSETHLLSFFKHTRLHRSRTELYVADSSNNRVRKIDPKGKR